MIREFFTALEDMKLDDKLNLHQFIKHLAFNDQGLIPVITQDFASNEVLMLAWMNQASLLKTLDSGRMTYWSRSRSEFWVKGESSGHYQYLKSMRFDCDGDALLCLVAQTGSACHTHRNNCFYFEADFKNQQISVITEKPEP